MKKRAAVNELKNQVAQISLEIAEKVIDTELANKDKQAQLVDKLLQDTVLYEIRKSCVEICQGPFRLFHSGARRKKSI